jgi:plastocyanin
MRATLLVLFALLYGSAAAAADLTVTVKTGAGRPVADAVVTVHPAAGTAPPVRFAWPLQVDQRNMKFEPFVLIVPVGGEVSFPNRDAVRHHVYSFSKTKPFELKLYGRDESRSVRFDRIGVVALGCNIHDSMVAFLKVVDTPFAAKTDAAGVVVLRGLPNGSSDVRVWHPYLRAPEGEVRRAVALRDGGAEIFAVELRAAPTAHRSY